jgi:hypothetical protein
VIFVSGSEEKNQHESGVELSSTNAVEATRSSTPLCPWPVWHRTKGLAVCGQIFLEADQTLRYMSSVAAS